jgi:hypothetical protein
MAHVAMIAETTVVTTVVMIAVHAATIVVAHAAEVLHVVLVVMIAVVHRSIAVDLRAAHVVMTVAMTVVMIAHHAVHAVMIVSQ